MSNHSEWSTLNNAQKELHRDLAKNQNSLKWILIISAGSLLVSVVNFVVMLSK